MSQRTVMMLTALLLVLSGAACGASMTDAGTFFDPGISRKFAEAIAEGNMPQIDALVSQGASVNVVGKGGMTLVYWAVLNRSRNGLTYLLGHGAEPNGVLDTKGAAIPGLLEDLEGTSPISIAAKLEDGWFLKRLAEHGGNINLINPLNGRTPLGEALASKRNENVRYLISSGADLNTVDRIGFTPLTEAIANQQFDMAYALLIAGADPKIPIARSGATVLTVIRQTATPVPPQFEWRAKVIELLKSKGLDVANGA
jgi:uncharacterized protein